MLENWSKQFRSSNDYFAFVSNAVKPALAGDGYAAYYISKALQTCLLVKTQYGQLPDPEAALNSNLAGAATWAADSQRRTFHLCQGFLKEDAFAGLPDRPGGYNSSRFWLTESYSDNNPIAQSFHAASLVAKVAASEPSTDKSTSATTAQADIDNAVASGSPDALFEVGLILANGHGTDPLHGFALSIAACDLGYDCSADSNTEYFGFCVAMGTCNPGTNFQDVVVNALGPSGYADAYARAQQIKTALSNGDTSSLQTFTKLKQ